MAARRKEMTERLNSAEEITAASANGSTASTRALLCNATEQDRSPERSLADERRAAREA
jgi:hypothetical protein